MSLKNKTSLIVIAVMTLLAGHNLCLADGGEVDLPDAKSTLSAPLYPNCEILSEGQMTRVTNDSPDKIMAFYKKTLGPYDVIEPYVDEANFRKGFSVIYRAHYKSKPQSELTELTRLTIMMTDSVTFKKKTMGYEHMIPQPLAQMRGLIGRYGHTQADYDKIFNQYQWVRFIQFWAPGTEGSLIIKKYHDKIFGPGPTAPPKAKAGDDARKADLKKKREKMKELQASGDMAAMMALAQEMQSEYSQTAEGEMTQQMQDQMTAGLEKDSWNDWTACLKEMAAAARWTCLDYTALKIWWLDDQDFWKQSKVVVNKK
jgi:antitoxin component HigA of HigAB toxin-antitoxin module